MSIKPQSGFGPGERKNILVVVKTYPNPSVRYQETVCVAGITDAGEWIRLYPLAYRYLDYKKQFAKYQWISIVVEKNQNDPRKESYRPYPESLELKSKVSTRNGWEERRKILLPTAKASLEELAGFYKTEGVSLGMFKPREVTEFHIKPCEKSWSAKHLNVLNQLRLFGPQPKPLEKIPFSFYYRYQCDEPKCKGHVQQIIDWEIYMLYRNLAQKGCSEREVEQKMREEWLGRMWHPSRDSYLIVGTRFPYKSFMVLGVFWPPKPAGV